MTGPEFSELKSALDLYASQYGATDKLWSYFSSITLAVLGFSVASDKVSKSFIEATVVVLGYVVFCFGNFSALYLSHSQLIQFTALVQPIAAKHQVTLSSLTPLSLASITWFYWSVVIAVCGGILFITWHRTVQSRVTESVLGSRKKR